MKALPLMTLKLRQRQFKRGSAQLAHVVNRMFTTLESKGILRTAPEEFMLTSLYKPHDPLAAEFFRTCRHEFFFGKQFVALYDAMRAKQAPRDASVALSKNTARATATDAESLYSFRPNHPDTFYVSAWEFPQWFKALQLKCPSHNYPFSKWTPAGRKKLAANDSEAMVAGEDYVFDFQKIGRMTGVYAYPEGKYVFDGAVPTNYTSFQKSWILLRRLRPMVPCPENTPLPSRRISKDARAKLFSIYLRPWTLSKKMATAEVPFLLDLARTPTGTAQDDATPTGTAQDLAQTPTGTAQNDARCGRS